MSIVVIFAKLINIVFLVVQLAMIIGFPIMFIKHLIVMPILDIRKKMKRGKTFRKAFKEAFLKVFKGNGKYHHLSATRPSFTASAQCAGTSSTEFTSNPAYSSIPGNIFYRP